MDKPKLQGNACGKPLFFFFFVFGVLIIECGGIDSRLLNPDLFYELGTKVPIYPNPMMKKAMACAKR